ncbi:MAG: hypothetical protein RL695_2271 [Pseudomonadota bacterium]
MSAHPQGQALAHLKALVASIRPQQARDHATAINNLRALSFLLEQQAAYRQLLQQQLRELFEQSHQVQLYTETGILSNEPLFAGLRRRIGERLLPVKPNPELLKDVVGLLFHQQDDHVWLVSVPYAVWADLWRSLFMGVSPVQGHGRLQVLEAIQVLSCRIASIGLEPEMLQNAADMTRFESPFMRQNVETLAFIECYRLALLEQRPLDDDPKQIMVLLDQCTAQIVRIRKHARRYGVSVSLTYHLLRLEQHVERMNLLLVLVEPQPSAGQGRALLQLFLQLVAAENRKNSLRDVLRQNTELLALQVTEHASHTGEHYIAETRGEWWAMFRAAAGAGVVVGFMALLKIMIAKLHLPPLIEALAFGLNYGLGFVIVHLLHGTIATKQPAMTAATIAATLPARGRRIGEGHRALVELIVKVARTQFIAILGNVIVVMPVAFLLGGLWALQFAEPVVSMEKSASLLHDLRPIAGYGLLHAAIAGVWLFVAGLISGYYDNKSLYHRIPERIAAHLLLIRVLGERRARQLGYYIEHNLGALAGNFYFGMMLGMTGFFGFLVGLPLDIRHITFSSAYLAFVAIATRFDLDSFALWLGLGGVILIGATNLAVSFALALATALRSRQRKFAELRPIAGVLVQRFFSRPRDFFISP